MSASPTMALAAGAPALGPVTFDLRGVDAVHVEAVTDILREIKGATDRIAKAARKWVALPEEVQAMVREGTPMALRDVWTRLERIGNGELHPLLYQAYGHGVNLLGRLPLEDQEKYLTEKLPVVIDRGGVRDNQRMAVQDLGPMLRLQVFAVSGRSVKVRTLAEQRAWLIEQGRKADERARKASKTVSIDRPGRWRVEDGRVHVDASLVARGLTLRDLLAMAKDVR